MASRGVLPVLDRAMDAFMTLSSSIMSSPPSSLSFPASSPGPWSEGLQLLDASPSIVFSSALVTSSAYVEIVAATIFKQGHRVR